MTNLALWKKQLAPDVNEFFVVNLEDFTTKEVSILLDATIGGSIQNNFPYKVNYKELYEVVLPHHFMLSELSKSPNKDIINKIPTKLLTYLIEGWKKFYSIGELITIIADCRTN